jgi:hypothetical protein
VNGSSGFNAELQWPEDEALLFLRKHSPTINDYRIAPRGRSAKSGLYRIITG